MFVKCHQRGNEFQIGRESIPGVLRAYTIIIFNVSLLLRCNLFLYFPPHTKDYRIKSDGGFWQLNFLEFESKLIPEKYINTRVKYVKVIKG